MPNLFALLLTLPGLTRRAGFFAAIFALVLVAGWLSGPAQAQDATIQGTVPPGRAFLPMVQTQGQPAATGCPATSTNGYQAVPILGAPRPSLPAPVADPDLNLKMRGWIITPAVAGLVALHGDTDADAPRLAQLFRPPRLATFGALHQVHDWNWTGPCAQSAEEPGCRGLPLVDPEVTLAAFATTPGEALYLPGRRHDILDGVYHALLLYAEETRLTAVYTRGDTPAYGYVVHLENLCVDANLLALYQQLDQAGRTWLPGLRLDVPLGTSRTETVMLAIRDNGRFMDPRSRKDWWQEY